MDDGAQIWLRDLKEMANLAPLGQECDWRVLNTIYILADELGQTCTENLV